MGGVEQDMTCSLEKVDRDNQANKRTHYGTLDAPVVMRARYTGLGENRMADFHWEVQGILRGRDDARLILKKTELFTDLASGEELRSRENLGRGQRF